MSTGLWILVALFTFVADTNSYSTSYIDIANSYCRSKDSHPYLRYNTKTSYDVVRGTAGSDSTCQPIKIWALHRHGTRYGSNSTMQDMRQGVDLQKQILENYAANVNINASNKLCKEDLEELTSWKWDESLESCGNELTTEGWRELREIAQRYQRRYPELMSDHKNNQLYFRHTKEQRTWASCRAYIEGLFGSYDNVTIDDPVENDTVIRSYKKCDAWNKDISDNDEFRKGEQNVFVEQADYLKLQKDVSERLGFQNILTKDQIKVMHDLCRYNLAWYPNLTSPWCSVFKKHEAFLLEYYLELSLYYQSGFGHEYNGKLGCMPLKNLLEVFDQTIQDKKSPTKGVFYFTHDTMINMFMTTLEYNKDDEALKGRGYEDSIVARKYRSSLSLAFAANVVAVLHQCSDEDYQVQLFLNEHPMNLNGCSQGLCSWDYFKSKYGFAKNCNLDFCNKVDSKNLKNKL